MGEHLVFLPLPARRALLTVRKAFPDAQVSIQRIGPIRRPVGATLRDGDETIAIQVLTPAELSAELRARKDASLDPLAAVRLEDDAWARRIVAVTKGTLREARPSPALRGLALCALVGRLQAEEDDWEGREQEPQRLLRWLEGHGADKALSDEERVWLTSPIGALPPEAAQRALPSMLANHAYALGVTDAPDDPDIPALMNALGYLADEMPKTRMRKGAERYLR